MDRQYIDRKISKYQEQDSRHQSGLTITRGGRVGKVLTNCCFSHAGVTAVKYMTVKSGPSDHQPMHNSLYSVHTLFSDILNRRLTSVTALLGAQKYLGSKQAILQHRRNMQVFEQGVYSTCVSYQCQCPSYGTVVTRGAMSLASYGVS